VPSDETTIPEPTPGQDKSARCRVEYVLEPAARLKLTALDELLDALSAARPLWDGRHPRRAAGAALAAVLTFLRKADASDPGDRHRPIGELLGALQDLERGSVPNLLKPAKLRGRPPLPVTMSTLRSQCVALADLLVRDTDMTPDDADRAVANLLNKQGISLGALDTSPKKGFASWRKRLRRTNCPPDERWVYDTMISRIPAMPAEADVERRLQRRRQLMTMLEVELEQINREGAGFEEEP
jgi:hypothetical protein